MDACSEWARIIEREGEGEKRENARGDYKNASVITKRDV